MRNRCLIAILACAMAGLVSAQSAHPNGATLKKQAMTWLKANNAFGPDHPLVEDLGGTVEKTLKQGKDFTVILGTKLTKSGKATALASHGDEVFALELTPEQLKKSNIKEGGAAFIQGGKCQDIVESPLPIHIEQPKLQGGSAVDGSKEFKGEVVIDQKKRPTGKLSVRITLSGENLALTLYSPIDRLPVADKAAIAFAFPPLNAKDKTKFQGLAIAFIDLCVVDPSQPEVIVVSNAKALLLDLK